MWVLSCSLNPPPDPPHSYSEDTNKPCIFKNFRTPQNSRGHPQFTQSTFLLCAKPLKLITIFKDYILMNKMVSLLEDYIAVLKEVEIRPDAPHETAAHRYHIPSDIVSSEDWAEFDNVYQIHCPSIFMDSAVRDVSSFPRSFHRFLKILSKIMVQYYYCSRDRRGFEYHMATRYFHSC
jgi:hypothetical protein